MRVHEAKRSFDYRVGRYENKLFVEWRCCLHHFKTLQRLFPDLLNPSAIFNRDQVAPINVLPFNSQLLFTLVTSLQKIDTKAAKKSNQCGYKWSDYL